MPAIFALSRPLSWIFPLIACATSGRIFFPLSSVLVGISHFSSASPSVLNRPHFTVVPPTSIPKQYLLIFSNLPIFFYSTVLRLFLIFLHIFHQTVLHAVIQLLSCIVSHLLLSVVDSSRLNDHRQITSRANGQ